MYGDVKSPGNKHMYRDVSYWDETYGDVTSLYWVPAVASGINLARIKHSPNSVRSNG